jgi:hypothetical protein
MRSAGQYLEGSNTQLYDRTFVMVIPLTQSQVIELVV